MKDLSLNIIPMHIFKKLKCSGHFLSVAAKNESIVSLRIDENPINSLPHILSHITVTFFLKQASGSGKTRNSVI